MKPAKPQGPVTVEARQRVFQALREALTKHKGILLAYVHGSFAEGRPFRDLDVAIYLADSKLPEASLSYELRLETELEEAVREVCAPIPVDPRVLNRAPLSFRYHVIQRGFPVLVRDDDLRADFEAATVSRYLDFAPFRREQLREVLGLGVR